MTPIRKAIQLYRTFREWIGDGRTVPQSEANERSSTCLDCPKHVIKPVQEIMTSKVAGIVQRQLEMKAAMKLSVDREPELHTCGICECWLPLKVWLPIERAREVTPDWQSFPGNCWLHR